MIKVIKILLLILFISILILLNIDSKKQKSQNQVLEQMFKNNMAYRGKQRMNELYKKSDFDSSKNDWFFN